MRIALLTGTTFSDATTRSVFLGLHSAFTKAGHQVRILTQPRKGPRALSFSPSTMPDVRGLRSPLGRSIERTLDRDRIDVLHLHFSGLFRSWMRCMLPVARRRRLVVSFQDYDHPELPANGPWALRQLRALLQESAGVTAVSDFLRRKLELAFPEQEGRIRTVHNGVDLPARRTRSRDTGKRPYILSVGRLAPYKGTDLLLMAFAEAAPAETDLVLCGAPFHKTHLSGLIDALGLRRRVRRTGLIRPEKVRRLMEGCLFYAAAPRAETFGMAAAEAMACGKAVLATRTGGIPEFVKDGRCGLLVPPKDIPALARGVRKLLADSRLRSRLGSAARRAASRLGWDRAARGYLKLYSR